jgi:putative membrane protein
MSYVLGHWSPAWAVLAIWAAVIAVHLSMWRGWRDRAWQSAAFHGGLLVVLLALVSPLAYWSLRYIWVRSIQDLLLAIVAPALIALGAPSWLPARDTPRGRRWLGWPMATTLAFNAVWLGWHLPALYDLAATNTAVRYAQWVLYLAAGVWFWLVVTGSGAPGRATAPMRRLALLVGTAAADTILGMVLVFGSGQLYPAYAGTGHHAFSVVSDQQVAGAVLWMGMLPPLIIAAVALLLRWLEHEESDELSRELDRLATGPTAGRPAWASSGRARRPTI